MQVVIQLKTHGFTRASMNKSNLHSQGARLTLIASRGNTEKCQTCIAARISRRSVCSVQAQNVDAQGRREQSALTLFHHHQLLVCRRISLVPVGRTIKYRTRTEAEVRPANNLLQQRKLKAHLPCHKLGVLQTLRKTRNSTHRTHLLSARDL